MLLAQAFSRIEGLPIAVAMRESTWLFPTVETVHVLSIALVVGTIARVDLRLLSILSPGASVRRVVSDLLPWTWGAFALAAASGSLMFCSQATKYAENLPFQLKVVLLALAGINMLAFHALAYRQVDQWNSGPTPNSAKAAAAASLAIWISVVGLGRWIGFV